MQHHHGDVGGSDSANTLSLIKVGGTESSQLLASFAAKVTETGVVKVVGNAFVFESFVFINRGLLAIHVASILHVVDNLLNHVGIDRAQRFANGDQVPPTCTRFA